MDRGSGRSNRGRGRFGRSHGSSEFKTDKGLIESLPYLRYRYGSSVVSPHKVQFFCKQSKITLCNTIAKDCIRFLN